MKLGVYCVCGGAMSGAASRPADVEFLTEVFWNAHTGEGHGPTTASVAATARRREERSPR